MNRIHLFLLFIIFLLIPLSVPAFSSLMPVTQSGCAENRIATGLDCLPPVLKAMDPAIVAVAPAAPDNQAGDAAVNHAVVPSGLQVLMKQDYVEDNKQWLLLVIFAMLILLVARIAPSMK